MTLESMSEADNPIMDNLMDASTVIDHERHIRDFRDRMKALVTKEHLQKVCEKYQRENGYFSRREPLAVFKRPGGAAIIWRQGSPKRPVNSLPKCFSSKQMAISEGSRHGVLKPAPGTPT